ncbi:hypothetical protein ART_3844 [Arthrobacter sp. PAMC 25486]|nr:hypothetical protein ART_3844 [Arthrobacter sp. PAMC 25486]
MFTGYAVRQGLQRYRRALVHPAAGTGNTSATAHGHPWDGFIPASAGNSFDPDIRPATHWAHPPALLQRGACAAISSGADGLHVSANETNSDPHRAPRIPTKYWPEGKDCSTSLPFKAELRM